MSSERKTTTGLSVQAYRRMPAYLSYLKLLREEGCESVSAAKAAAHFGFTEIQVRKDFAAVCPTGGRPRAGFALETLIAHMEDCLGFRNVTEAVLVGVGSLGHALLTYEGFEAYGLNIVAAFDSDPRKCGREIAGKRVLPVDSVSDLCRRMSIPIGIVAVPSEHAQQVCDGLVSGGVKAVWNFAPVQLSVPSHVLVQNENMAVSLALLSRHLREAMEG